jgi:hypothetical protein
LKREWQKILLTVGCVSKFFYFPMKQVKMGFEIARLKIIVKRPVKPADPSDQTCKSVSCSGESEPPPPQDRRRLPAFLPSHPRLYKIRTDEAAGKESFTRTAKIGPIK